MIPATAHDRYEGIAPRLESVSPSRYGMLRAWKDGQICPLQLLWRGKAPLAPYPAAKLGDVVHRMLDQLPTCADQDEAKNAWDKALVHIESLLDQDWVTRGLLPLSRTVRGFTLKKILAIRSALQSEPKVQQIGGGAGLPVALCEEDLLSSDGMLKGRADLIEQRDGEWVLVDYKSGAVHEDEDEPGGPRIKDEYVLQLRLYAHLIREAKDIIIGRALLRTLDGREHEVSVDEATVKEAGAEARWLLAEFNDEIQRHLDPLVLAKPMAANWARGVFGCAACLHRPRCRSYLTCEKQSQEGDRWPNDAWGTVKSINRAGGSVLVEIQNQNCILSASIQGQKDLITVKLKDDPERHPNLSKVKVGSMIQLYDLVEPRLGVVAQDGPRTCVYNDEITQELIDFRPTRSASVA